MHGGGHRELGEESTQAGSRRRVCRPNRARSQGDHTACIWTGYSAGDAIACGNGKEEGRDSEGLLAFMREFADRRSRSSGASSERKESRARSEVLSRSGEQMGAGRGRATRNLANFARRWSKSVACRLWAGDRAWSWIA